MERWFAGFHHFYLGIALAVVGFTLMGAGWYWVGLFTILTGLLVIVDGAWQHFKQRSDPEYRSPLHKLYGVIYSKFAFIRWLNKIADKALGRQLK